VAPAAGAQLTQRHTATHFFIRVAWRPASTESLSQTGVTGRTATKKKTEEKWPQKSTKGLKEDISLGAENRRQKKS
jgi:hypothetical protein